MLANIVWSVLMQMKQVWEDLVQYNMANML